MLPHNSLVYPAALGISPIPEAG